MAGKEGKRLLAKRLYLELRMFRYSTLRKSKKEIYESSYKIELFSAIYEVLLESLEYINEDTAYHLLWWNGGILEFLYEEWLKKDEFRHSPMYILTNDFNINGASGILDKELLKEFAGNKNYFIFLSCMHEAIFLLDDGELEIEEINKLVAEVYRNAVSEEERLSEHCYYYNGETGEISMDKLY